jgi:putative transcriptional regulator
MSQNAWINVDASSDILFDTPAENRYQMALAKLGIDPVMLAGDAGHA